MTSRSRSSIWIFRIASRRCSGSSRANGDALDESTQPLRSILVFLVLVLSTSYGLPSEAHVKGRITLVDAWRRPTRDRAPNGSAHEPCLRHRRAALSEAALARYVHQHFSHRPLRQSPKRSLYILKRENPVN